MKILATDLDRTLLPNGSWEADEGAVELFNRLTEEQGVTVVYVTGRNLELTEKAIGKYGVRRPDVLCGDVGTTIREWRDGGWATDPGWDPAVRKASPKWDAGAVRDAVAGVDGMREQEARHQNPFKQSYYVDAAKKDAVLAAVAERAEGRFDEAVVYSFDSQAGTGLIDFLPAAATKRTSLEYVASKLGERTRDVVFCGDSGNDVLPLTAGFSGVLVKNADEQLVAKVREAQAKDPSLRAYFAKGGFHGLSGNYTSGVIEGACHYGLLKMPPKPQGS